MKNVDVVSNKFKDLSLLIKDSKINNLKSFNSIEEIYFYLEELFKNGIVLDNNFIINILKIKNENKNKDFLKHKYLWLLMYLLRI